MKDWGRRKKGTSKWMRKMKRKIIEGEYHRVEREKVHRNAEEEEKTGMWEKTTKSWFKAKTLRWINSTNIDKDKFMINEKEIISIVHSTEDSRSPQGRGSLNEVCSIYAGKESAKKIRSMRRIDTNLPWTWSGEYCRIQWNVYTRTFFTKYRFFWRSCPAETFLEEKKKTKEREKKVSRVVIIWRCRFYKSEIIAGH